MDHAIAIGCVVAALYWAFALYAVARTIGALPSLARDRSPPPSAWPRISLIVPARDEERDLERALRSRLADDYPSLEVILVDDRSTDATPAIADRLAREESRLQVIHVDALPDGWLGKLHALHRGVAAASGEWLLFSDADVEFSPGTLRRAIARCEKDGADHMAVVPRYREHGIAVDAAVDLYCHGIAVAGRPWRALDPRSPMSIGAGLFNLVRRAAFERTPGFEWLRLEIADDIALGQMLKQHGARPILMNAVGAVSLDFYREMQEMARAMEKSGFAVIGQFRAGVLALVCATVLLVGGGFLAGLAHPAAWVRGLALGTALVAAISQSVLARALGRSLLPALMLPLGAALMAFMMARSGVLAWRRGGVDWRGTVYPVASLRAGSRLRIR